MRLTYHSPILTLLFLSALNSNAQILSSTIENETAFITATKQVNQFFRRFNSEEAFDGKRYYETDSLYRSPKTRKQFLQILFDNSNHTITDELKSKFILKVTDSINPHYLDFHGGNWFAEVSTIFYWHGKEENATLYMKLQEEKIGSKWVISDIIFQPFIELFKKDASDSTHFLHPLSHELEFMNLYNVFHDNKDKLQDYTDKTFTPDYLSVFIYAIKNGDLKFKTVYEVKFHFFQIAGWYFELSDFNRSGYNTGWLISRLTDLHQENKETLLRQIYEHSK